MKVLIASKFFYPRGGDTLVAMATKRLLEAHGHEVRIFAMEYPENLELPDCAGYASQVGFGGGIKNKLRGVWRSFGKGDGASAARKVIEDFKPDVVHLHNVHSYLSPVIGEIAHKRGIKVVWTLHDYKLICPSYSFRRPDGTICQECLADKGALMRHRCMKGSLAASLLARLEAAVWNRKRMVSFTDTFITPSRFMEEKMKEGGFPAEKIVTLCNFIDPAKFAVLESLPVRKQGNGYFCYIGRLSQEKGIPTLLAAATEADVKLKVAGDGPLMQPMKEQYSANKNIEFLGKQNAEEVTRLLNGADAMLITSEWYENNPLSVIESLCAGTPVIGAKIGGIPELIEESNGQLYPSGDPKALAVLLRSFDADSYDRSAIAKKARRDFCEDNHYRKLMQLYTSI